MFKLYKKVESDLYDFTDYCSDISLRSSKNEISEELSFTINSKILSESDIINLYEDNKLIFEGIIVNLDIVENYSYISAFDFGWYLNKNKEAYQFNDSVSNCIKRILNDFEVPIGDIAQININYKKINKDSIKNIINKIVEYATKNIGKEYIWEMRANKFYLYELSKNYITLKTNEFGNNIDITELLSNPIHNRSINNLKNAIKVVNQEENSISVLAYKEDSKSIEKYGKLQELEYVTKEEKNNANNIAISQLSLLNKVENKISFKTIGNIECRANRALKIKNDILGVDGIYKIIECEHSISANYHTMNLKLELIQ